MKYDKYAIGRVLTSLPIITFDISHPPNAKLQVSQEPKIVKLLPVTIDNTNANCYTAYDLVMYISNNME